LLMKLMWAWPGEGRVADKGARCLGAQRVTEGGTLGQRVRN
jgi:hypothetical protein